MKSVVIHAEGDVRVEERPIPQIQADDDVLIKVISSGLCGSDIPVFSPTERIIIQSR